MKVTVCFGETRVVVPCGQGEFLVSELIEKAITRYRKAAGKPSDHYVHIHTLKSQSDGGILDLDDVLSDVVDDREQIVAEYEEHNGPSAPQGGDGTSGSSVGSASPDVFQSNRKMIPPQNIPPNKVLPPSQTTSHRSSPQPMTVRSSPAMIYMDNRSERGHVYNNIKQTDKVIDDSQKQRNRPEKLPQRHYGDDPMLTSTTGQTSRPINDKPTGFPMVLRTQPERITPPILNNTIDKRHSVEVTEQDLNSGTGLQVLSVRRDSEPNIAVTMEQGDTPSTPAEDVWTQEHHKQSSQTARESSVSSGDESDTQGFNKFARDSARQSLTSQNVLKWASAQEKQHASPGEKQQESETDVRQGGRREPLGQSQSPGDGRTAAAATSAAADTQLIVLKNEGGPLGIHVVPHRDHRDRECGLAIQGIEAGGRVDRSAKFKINDVIIEINGHSLQNANFTEAQEIFRSALQTKEIKIKIQRTGSHNENQEKPPSTDIVTSEGQKKLMKSAPPLPPTRSPSTALSAQSSASTLPSTSPTKQSNDMNSLPAPPMSPTDGSSQILMQGNTRKLGKKIHIDLTKGPEGLGFSITTRDNPAGGQAAPIYVKNILPKGAAITDGRLKSGDRLLEVNGMDMTGKSQDEVVAILRNTKRGSTVSLCVSRVDSGVESTSLPRQMLLLANTLRFNNNLFVASDEQDDTIDPPYVPKVIKAAEDISPSNERKTLTFNIPLNETGSAGLGISVKGKTTTVDGVTKDLGIFIKAVIHGGAASKDGRLQINDQLLLVNDDDLVNKTNSEAMDSLRQAMHTEGPLPGHIKISVSRKTDNTATLPTSEPPNNAVSKMDQINTEISNSVTATMERMTPTINVTEPSANSSLIESLRNPVLDRITRGGSAPNQFRNESYHLATADDSDREDNYDPPNMYSNKSTIPTPTRIHINSDVMMIEEDNEQTVLQQPRRKEPEPSSKSRLAAEAKQKGEKPLEKHSATPPPETPDVEQSNPNSFDREAFGRRSFSEKRKASNGKSKEVVDKVKALREELKQGHDTSSKPPTSLTLKPAHIDYSITSAYEPAGSPSIPTPPSNLQRTTSYKHPSRHTLYSQQPPFNRTYSTTSYNGVNGRRPVPAPRLSLGSRSDADYQTVDYSMPDVQIKEGISPAQITSAQQFLYPAASPNEENSQFKRASTLPLSTERPSLLYQVTSKIPDYNDKSKSMTTPYPFLIADGHYDDDDDSNSKTSTLENQSSSQSSTVRTGHQQVNRVNSRTSMTDLEKRERRKSELLESSPYPKLSSLAVDDLEVSVAGPKTADLVNNNNNLTSAAAVAVAAPQSEPIYTQINKVPVSCTNATGGSEQTHNMFSCAEALNTNNEDAANIKSPRSDTSYIYNTCNSPIYERIGAAHSSSPPPTFGYTPNSTHYFSGDNIVGHRASNGRLIRVGSAESLISNNPVYDQVAYNIEANARDASMGPNLGLVKNSSFESLQAMLEDSSRSPEVERSYHKPPSRVARGRGCNESFRAAVDRSYDPSGGNNMEPAKRSQMRQRARILSASINVTSDRRVSEESEFMNLRNAPTNASFSGEPDLEKKKNKKSKNILGLLRFHKGRKSLEERSKVSNKSSSSKNLKDEKEKITNIKSQEEEKIQDYYKRLQEKQKHQTVDSHNQQPDYGTYPRGDRLRINPTSTAPPPVPAHGTGTEKADKLANIRAEHQRRHQERQGLYPKEAQEDFYERKMREREKEWAKGRHNHSKSYSIDDPSNLEFFAEINNRAYGAGTEFKPRLKSTQPGTSSSGQSRYSFYADPRYYDYHRSTQSNYYTVDYNNSNSRTSSVHMSPYMNRMDVYSSLPKRDQLPSKIESIRSDDRQLGSHQRYKSYDSKPSNSYNSRLDPLSDYDDPMRVENSLYAQVHKMPVGNKVSSPAQV